MVVSGQEHHSVQKRQTTVTYSQDWTEIASSFVSAAVTIGIITLTWWVVAPIFGFETLISRQGLDFQEADYGGYYNYQYSSNQYDPGYSYYNYYQGRSFQAHCSHSVALTGNATFAATSSWPQVPVSATECEQRGSQKSLPVPPQTSVGGGNGEDAKLL